MLWLSVLMRTTRAPYSEPFLKYARALTHRLEAELVVVQEMNGALAYPDADTLVMTDAAGLPDNIVDAGVRECHGAYVLRLDDDETCSTAMEQWLDAREYTAHDHWKFPRAHFYQNQDRMIVTPHLWPDHQTRLSTKGKSGGLHGQHAGSPFGGGEVAPVHLEHHKFIVRSYAERLARAKEYDSWRAGDGTGGMRPFSLPEDHYVDPPTVPYTNDPELLRGRIAAAQEVWVPGMETRR